MLVEPAPAPPAISTCHYRCQGIDGTPVNKEVGSFLLPGSLLASLVN